MICVRAVIIEDLGGTEVIKFVEHPDPEPQAGQVVVGDLPKHPVYLVAGEWLDGRYAALVDQPIVIGQYRRPRISRVRTAPCHLSDAQVRPICEVEMPARLHSAAHRQTNRHQVSLCASYSYVKRGSREPPGPRAYGQ